jgi:hypothetical protein
MSTERPARAATSGSGRGRLAWWLLLGVVLAAGWFQEDNLDLGLHARTGQWIVEHGRVPTVNVMSRLHADHPAVDDKWGFQVLAHLLLDDVGPDACVVARDLLILALFAVMAATARALGASPWSTTFWLLLALVAGRSRFPFRPDLASCLFIVIVAHVLLVSRRDGRGSWRLIPLQLLWVNVHGYFITGPLMLGTVAAAQALAGTDGRAVARRLLPVGAGMLAVCLVNPAGIDGALHPLRILQDLSAHEDFYRGAITEFRPTLGDDPRQPWDRLAYAALGLSAAAMLALAALAACRRADGAVRSPVETQRGARAGHASAPTTAATTSSAEPSAPPTSAPGTTRGDAFAALALCGLFGAMSFSLQRNMAPFAFVVAPLAAGAWSRRLAGPRSGTTRMPAVLARAGPPLVAGFALFVAWGELSDTISIHDGLDRRAGHGLSSIAYPDAGIAFIARELPTRSVFTAFSYGSTFTGRRWPGQVASTDGNTHGYPTEYLEEVLAASASDDSAGFRRICARDGHDVALLPMDLPLSIALVRDGDAQDAAARAAATRDGTTRDAGRGAGEWALACVGLREAVWVRRAAMDPAWLEQHDLLAHWRRGEAVVLPDTPDPGTLLGLRKAFVPLAEIDQATLLAAADLPQAALARARVAVTRAPHDAESLAMQGLLCARLGQVGEARELLRRSADGTGFNRLADAAATVLARLPP